MMRKYLLMFGTVLLPALCSVGRGQTVDHIPATRAEAIARTRARIEAQVEAHGGSWEAWIERLAPYRADLAKYRRGGSTRSAFTFSRTAVGLHLADDIFGRAEGRDPFAAFVHFDRELKKHGIDLIVAIIPSKLSAYPDYALTDGRAYCRLAGEAVPLRADQVERRSLNALADDVMPDHWLFCGPFPGRHEDGDVLEDVGGSASTVPRAGRRVQYRGHAATFRPFPSDCRWTDKTFTASRPSLDLTKASHRQYDSTTTFFCLVTNDTPRTVRLELVTPGARRWTPKARADAKAWLGGVAFDEQTAVRLGKGVYGFTVQVVMGVCDPWGRIWVAPRLMDVTDDDIVAGDEPPPNAVRVPQDGLVSVALKRFMHRLLENDVEVIDLHTAFRDSRKEHGDAERLFYARDSHWMNRGARLAARLIAERLQRYDFVQEAMQRENPFVLVPYQRLEGPKTDLDVQKVRGRDGEARPNAVDSPVIVAGDSFQGYNSHLGAQCALHVAYGIHMPVYCLTRSGLSGSVPVFLARDEHLAKRRVVVVSFNEKILPGGNWPLVDLPEPSHAAVAGTTAVRDVAATANVSTHSARPPKAGPYPHHLMKFYMTGLKGPDGEPVGSGDGVVHVLAKHNRKLLPAADIQTGARLELRLTSWRLMDEAYKRIETGDLDDLELELKKELYWGVLPGQPELTEDDLKRAVEEQ